LRFDRKAGRIDRLNVERSETRKPGRSRRAWKSRAR
jgi:hypothetical protein